MSSGSGRVLEVTGGSNGSNFNISTNQQSVNQQFKINYHNNGYFSIMSRASRNSRGADVVNFSTASGADVIQWDFHKGLNQLWRFERVQTGIDLGTDPIPLFDDATLLSLTVNGNRLADFDPQQYVYNVLLPHGTTANPVVAAVSNDVAADVSITQAASPTGTATVEVTAEDRITISTYSIAFDVETSVISIAEGTLSVYPNPVGSGQQLTVEFGGGSLRDVSISIHSIAGRLLYQSQVGSNRHTIDSQLQPGVYILSVSSGAERFTQRLVVY